MIGYKNSQNNVNSCDLPHSQETIIIGCYLYGLVEYANAKMWTSDQTVQNQLTYSCDWLKKFTD